nr:hypothetical protein [Nanoarchaeota archaeon]
MKIKMVLLILLLLLIVLSGCKQVSEEPVGKASGGVIICGKDCPCGKVDNVCPEDYGADCKVKDPDCK